MGFIFRSVRAAGGWLNALRQTIRLNEVRIGSEVGRDEFGNVYYESKEYFYDDWRMALDQNLLVVVIMFNLSRDRWIDYNRRDYDASQVPPEWYTLKAQQFFVYVIYLPSGLARLTDSIGSVVQSGRPHISECKLMDIMAQLTNSITAGIIYHFNRVF
jgi:NADH:ubiquinone oxidoreductase subunit